MAQGESGRKTAAKVLAGMFVLFVLVCSGKLFQQVDADEIV